MLTDRFREDRLWGPGRSRGSGPKEFLSEQSYNDAMRSILLTPEGLSDPTPKMGLQGFTRQAYAWHIV